MNQEEKKNIYDVVFSNDFDEFVYLVNDMLEVGYRCQGGVGVSFDREHNLEYFYQAIIKELDEPDSENENNSDPNPF